MDLPATRAVVGALEAAGGPGCARFVGGCVRDAVLGRIPPGAAGLDIDIATPLEPPAVVRALETAGLRAVPTGIVHGTVTAIARGRPYEVTTLRRDVETDGRRAVVAFTDDWVQDAARRDFRLNALYAGSDGALHDPTGEGVADALAGRIVFVGDAATRIAEDRLRILRFFRFQAWYGRGPPDAAGLAACAQGVEGIGALSGERVQKELLKLLAAPDPRAAVRAMAAAGVLGACAPGLPAGAGGLDRFDRLVGVERAACEPPDALLRLAALLAPGSAWGEAAARLRLPNAQRDRLRAAGAGEVSAGWGSAQRRRAVWELGPQRTFDLARLARADDPADAPGWRALEAVAREWTPPAFPLTGADAKAAGVAPGPGMGRLLRDLELAWADGDFAADRPALLARLAAAAR